MSSAAVDGGGTVVHGEPASGTISGHHGARDPGETTLPSVDPPSADVPFDIDPLHPVVRPAAAAASRRRWRRVTPECNRAPATPLLRSSRNRDVMCGEMTITTTAA